MKQATLALMICAVVLAACASGSVIVTGAKRPPVAPETVKLYTTPPKSFVEIAIVKAESDAGFSQQAQVDRAVAELKRQAGNVGANGVLLVATGTQTGVVAIPVYGGGTIIAPTETQLVEGRAIFVSAE